MWRHSIDTNDSITAVVMHCGHDQGALTYSTTYGRLRSWVAIRASSARMIRTTDITAVVLSYGHDYS